MLDLKKITARTILPKKKQHFKLLTAELKAEIELKCNKKIAWQRGLTKKSYKIHPMETIELVKEKTGYCLNFLSGVWYIVEHSNV